MSAYDTIFAALAGEARRSFAGIVDDIEQNVVPNMASLAMNLVVIGERRASGAYDAADAANALDAQRAAAASVIVRFANDVLKAIDDLIAALLKAVAAIVNVAVGAAIL